MHPYTITYNQKLMTHACKMGWLTYGVVKWYNWLLIILLPITGDQSYINLMDDWNQQKSFTS